MTPGKRLRLPLLLLIVLSFWSFGLAQNTKQELNDQLFEAARKGDAAAVTVLLDKGADVNAKFRYGTTALFKAAERGNVEVVKVLIARGVDVNVKDTFYNTTAMSWALDNKHVEVVRLLLEKSPESVGDVLMTGVQEGSSEFVSMALKRGGAKPETLTSALVAATTGERKNDEIAAMLTKAGAVPPPEIDAATLQSYVGKYRGEPGPEVSITLVAGKLTAVVLGQRPFTLMAVNGTTFKPAAFEGVTITFTVVGGKTSGFALQQGTTTTQLKRVE